MLGYSIMSLVINGLAFSAFLFYFIYGPFTEWPLAASLVGLYV
jgi:hypothetical protein